LQWRIKYSTDPDGPLQVRIGIVTGLVVVSSGEKGAVGETMHLASRLHVIAQPGSIVVSERVQRLAGGAFDYEDLGEQVLKGLAQPTHAYRELRGQCHTFRPKKLNRRTEFDNFV